MPLSDLSGSPAMRSQPAWKRALGLLCVFASFACLSSGLAAQSDDSSASARERLHQSDQWMEIEKHLPDPATASPEMLEQQADILRVRRFPDDAMDYYKDALARGGDPASLLNKLGLMQLEMKNVVLARSYFQRAAKASHNNAEAWNNLGAVDYMDGAASEAISDYKKAIKLDKRQAVFHANLSTAYFENKDYSGARREMAAALKLDPRIFEDKGSGGGVSAHVLSSGERARFSFEMAKLYAQDGLEEQMLHSLAMASEAGMDVQREMRKDQAMAKFEMDPRVLVLVHNAQALHAGHGSTVSASSLPDTVVASAKPL